VASVLARHIPISVSAAVDGGALHLGSAHVAPPGWHLVVAGGALRLLDAPPVRFVKPSADVLFGSAAAAFGRRLASVVLSGTGSDGAAGSGLVRKYGGTTFAQDPGEAEFGGMPAAAIATGDVQHVLPVSDLARVLGRAVLRGRTAFVH
jgi:two-component system chemotaxis response regulator CheB